MKASLWLAFLLLTATAFLASCGESKPAQASIPAASAATTVSQPAPVQDDTFVASGPIVVENQIDVAAQREGIVLRTLAEPGLRVKKNQLLAELDGRQITADLEAARAKTRSIEADLKNWESEAKVLESDYQRAQKMWDAQLITKEQLDHARFKAESDQWDVKRVQELLVNARQNERSLELEREKTRILAPFDGIVARRYVREGQKVAVGDRLFWVTAEGPLLVKFTLPGRFVSRVKRGEALAVSSSDSPTPTYQAKVIGISPVVDPSSGTIEVEGQLVGSAGDLRPGMTATVRLANPQ